MSLEALPTWWTVSLDLTAKYVVTPLAGARFFHMPKLRAALVTTLSGPLATYGHASSTGLTLWARYAARLPPPWTGVELDIRDTGADPAAAMRAAIDTHPDVLFGPYGSSIMLAAMRVTDRAVCNHAGSTSQLSGPTLALST